MVRNTLYRALKAIGPFRRVVRYLRARLDIYRPNVWVLEGTERWSGECLKVVVTGQLEHRNFLANLVFGGPWAEITRRRMWLWNIFRLANRRGTDYGLVMVDTAVPSCRAYEKYGWFLVPAWIRTEVDLMTAAEQIKRSTSIKSDLSKIRKNRFEFEIRTGEDEFEHFYHETYIPYARNVYGDMAFLDTYEDMKNKVGICEFLVITQDTGQIAEQMLLYEDGGIRAYALGIKGANREYVKQGALAAVYYFSILYATRKGHKKLHLGGARPFVKDGVLQYKKKWGARIVGNTSRWFVFKVVHESVATRAFLAKNPFVYESDGKLVGAVFIDDGTFCSNEEVKRIERDYHDLGLGSVRIFDLSHTRTTDASNLFPQVSESDVAVRRI